MENNNNNNINRLENDFDKLKISLNHNDYLTNLGMNRKLDFENSNNNNNNNYQDFENNLLDGSSTCTASIDVDTLFKDEFNDQNHINFNYRNDINNLSILSSANGGNMDFSNNKNEPIGIFHSQQYNHSNPINFNNDEDDDDDMDTVIKIEEDDLLDERPQLRTIFKDEFFDKSECVCDVSQGSFTCKKGKFSKSLQRKLVNLHQLLNNHQLYQPEDDTTVSEIQNLIRSALTNDDHTSDLSTSNPNNKSLVIYSIQNSDYKKKLFRLLRSIVERISIDALMLCDQYHNQLQNYEQIIQSSNTSITTNLNNPATKLWNEIKNRGCQFLGPQMQDDALRLILHALETVTRMSRKVLVLYVVHMLKKHYPKASKTSVSHVVQLLYRAGCFKMEKRTNEASLMELKKEFSKYSALRRQHDAQIIQIALESGIHLFSIHINILIN